MYEMFFKPCFTQSGLFFSVKVHNFAFRCCQGCQGEMKDQNVYICKVCQNVFCVDCDLFIHDCLHCCPGCVHGHSAPTSAWCHVSVIPAYIWFAYSAMAFSEAPQSKEDIDDYRRMNTGLGANFFANVLMILLLIIYSWIMYIWLICSCQKSSGFLNVTLSNMYICKCESDETGFMIIWQFIYVSLNVQKRSPANIFYISIVISSRF